MKKILIILPFTLLILLGFATPLNLTNGWYQQNLPNIGNRQITDITFVDSSTGYAASSQSSDTSYILKTTNSGDNWQIIYRNYFAMTQLQFLNENTGYAGGGYLYKTTDGGFNWTQLNTPAVSVENMHVLNQDTIWFVWSEGAFGGVFRTTNGGINWTGQQMTNGNPNKIYFYNRLLGFASSASGNVLYRTSNSGLNWSVVTGTEGFTDIKFINDITGWKTRGSIKKTTNSGLNWIQQILPSGGIILSNAINKISVINKDTIWGVGGSVFYGSGQFRGILFRTINGGINWLFQVPDTTIHLDYYSHIQFINKNIGWAYRSFEGGIHTTTGGDPVWYTDVKQISSKIPLRYKLYQNFPNPFNPKTIIRYDVRNQSEGFLTEMSEVRLVVYDINGREVITLVNQRQNSGTYEIDFNGSKFASGIYFYSLLIDNKLIDTKKMLMLK
jgi:photosystem II stability/assembly factor-like uncharacterized protein